MTNYTDTWTELAGRARLTPTAVRLPDGSHYPLFEGIGATEDGVRVQLHPANDHVTIVRAGELLWIDATLTVRRRALPPVSMLTGVGWQCPIHYQVASEVAAMIGASVAVRQMASVASQTQAIFQGYTEIAVPVALGEIDTVSLGVYSTPLRTLEAYRVAVAPVSACAQYLGAARGFSDGTIGIAYVGAGCLSDYGVGMIFDVLDASVAVITLAHEIGHTMGAEHNDDSSRIMYPTLSSSTLPGFASDSVTAMRNWADAALCLVQGNFTSGSPPSASPLSAGAISGIVVGAIAILTLLGVLAYYNRHPRKSVVFVHV